MTRIYLTWPTHQQMISLLVYIIRNDDITPTAHILTRPLASGENPQTILETGVKDADTLSPGYVPHNLHFHHPWTHRGYITRASAADAATARCRAATRLWPVKQHLALYEIGRALHLIQDMWVPHHAALRVLSGHGRFERYLAGAWTSFAVTSGGFYRWSQEFHHPRHGKHQCDSNDPMGFIELGAHTSYPLLDKARSDCVTDHQQAASLLIPGCLRASAGFLHMAISTATTAPNRSIGAGQCSVKREMDTLDGYSGA